MSANFEMFVGKSKILHAITYQGKTTTRQDITDMTIHWGMWIVNSEPLLVEKTTGDGITITSAVQGEFDVEIEPADTVGFEPGTYYHECEITDSNGHKAPVFSGNAVIYSSNL